MSRSQEYKNLKKCTMCKCYSVIESNVIHLLDNIYKLILKHQDIYYIFEYNISNIKNFIICNSCVLDICKLTNLKCKNIKHFNHITSCTLCNKKIGKPVSIRYPCNNVIFITDEIFVTDCYNNNKYCETKKKYYTEKIINVDFNNIDDEYEEFLKKKIKWYNRHI